MRFVKTNLFAASLAVIASAAMAQTPVKIGMVTTLSGPGGYLGEDVRDGFQLAIDAEGGKLGGVPVAVTVEDDALKPGQGKQIAERYIKNENMKIVTGIIFSNVAGAVVPDVVDAGAFYFSPNSGLSNLAGKDCHKNYFVVSWQNDNLHESVGEVANNLKFKKVFIVAANYQAGRDAVAGFKRFYKGAVAGEIYPRLDQTDFAAEIAQIRAAEPDAVYKFLPGGLGIAFIKQYDQAGLKAKVPLVVSAAGADARMLAALGDAGVGIYSSSFWNDDFPNPESKKFVEAFKKKYNRVPTTYAAQGYDTALSIATGLKAVDGDMGKADAFRAAVRKADFPTVRGKFKYGPNQNPIQDWYQLVAEKQADGKVLNKTQAKIMTDLADVYAKECKL